MVFSIKNRCKTCGEIYTMKDYSWCKSCQINKLKTNRTSGNEKIDDFIQEMQLKINSPWDIVFEWISYNQFNKIKEIYKDGVIIVYSAEWTNGLLEYNISKRKYIRSQNTKVALKCLYNSQNITNELLNNKVWNFL